MKLSARGLRDAVVGGVADEQVAEAESLGRPWSVGGWGRSSSLRTRFAIAPSTSIADRLASKRTDGASVKDLSLDRAALEQLALLDREPLKARGEQRLDRRRYSQSSRARGPDAAISSRNSGLPSLAAITRARSSRRQAVAELIQ